MTTNEQLDLFSNPATTCWRCGCDIDPDNPLAVKLSSNWGPGEPPFIEHMTRTGQVRRRYLPAWECLSCNHAVAHEQLVGYLRNHGWSPHAAESYLAATGRDV